MTSLSNITRQRTHVTHHTPHTNDPDAPLLKDPDVTHQRLRCRKPHCQKPNILHRPQHNSNKRHSNKRHINITAIRDMSTLQQ